MNERSSVVNYIYTLIGESIIVYVAADRMEMDGWVCGWWRSVVIKSESMFCDTVQWATKIENCNLHFPEQESDGGDGCVGTWCFRLDRRCFIYDWSTERGTLVH